MLRADVAPCTLAPNSGLKISELVDTLSPVDHEGLSQGLKETFMKRYVVERTRPAEIRSEEQGEKAKSCRENLCNETEFKGP